jgi:integrase
MPNDRIPRVSCHKATGQAVVRLNGKDYYLGRFRNAASNAAYERLIAEWLANGRRLPEPERVIRVNDLILAYWQRCKIHYRKPNGDASSELDLVRLAMRPLKSLYGRTQASAFGPKSLKIVRAALVKAGLSRGVVNAHIGRIKRMFRWAVENEIVPPSTYHGLQALIGLQRGRSEARETAPVKPVPDAIVDATLPHLPPPVAAMVELQRLTGMRPGEACALRAIDIDMSENVWVYRPVSHKTLWRGNHHQVFIGPKAQAIIRDWVRADLTAFLFDPRVAEAARNAARRLTRKTPMTPSQARRRRKRNPLRSRGVCYTVTSYRRAIQRACDSAFPPPAPLAPKDSESATEWFARLTPQERDRLKMWRREHRWHPHQLRHNVATSFRKVHGVELARIILGHAKIATTEIYAEADRQQAFDVMARIG